METILSRDQRTTSHRVLDRATQSYALNSTLPPKCQDDIVANSRSIGATTTNCAKKCLPCDLCYMTVSCNNRRVRLRSTSVIRLMVPTWLCFYFWLSIFAVVLAAPVHNNSTMDDCCKDGNVITEYILAKLKTPRKWEDPCGNTVVHNTDIQNTDSQNIDSQAESVIIAQLIDGIIIVTRNALTHATMFRQRFIEENLMKKYDPTNLPLDTWKYHWLPKIPKEIGEKLSDEYLNTINFDKAIIESYNYMQKYAMALEQTVWDQESLHLGFYDEFRRSEFNIRNILCELHNAITVRPLTTPKPVQRSEMPDAYRVESFRRNETARNVRDWVCYRDYMNCLEYMEQIFYHLRLQYKLISENDEKIGKGLSDDDSSSLILEN
ncbi:uncharacterized protein LOC126850319 isoform X1 [Cataglyphis hispanica]|uniref:uncharacterized protein LOC126850319 isoform X1 n=1 Tax=Cataglyphis hispanica TaxID=1086592 RepID=UPI00217F6AB1|nr:uncharacterized protein LOC126850319 isoform X1 [Cataglyphis hispanica]